MSCLGALNTPCPVIDAAEGSQHNSCIHKSLSDELRQVSAVLKELVSPVDTTDP